MQSRRENGGLCPHPPKGSIPWESLFGERPPFSRGPVPNAAGGRPLLVGLPPSIPFTAPFGTKRSNPAPFVTGRGCVAFAPKALSAGTAGAGAGQ